MTLWKMSSTSPKNSLIKLGFQKQKPFRVLVLGTSGVGKTAMVVRFITNRFICDYGNLEKVYSFNTVVDNEIVMFEILDDCTAGQINESINLEANIRWAEAFILMYSVTDKCSFDECNRLKFLINYNKRRRRLVSNNSKDGNLDVPVILVGNKMDQDNDRMVTTIEGQKRAREISCACFHEISVRESIDQVWGVFQDVSRFWRILCKNPKLKRSTSDTHDLQFDDLIVSPERVHPFITCDFQTEKRRSILLLGRSSWKLKDLLDQEEKDEFDEKSSSIVPFRNRALTDGTLLSKRKYRMPIIPQTIIPSNTRRNSISMRGNAT